MSIRGNAGFTLIEMMCAMAVAGVLSSVAYPAYQSVVQKTRRADAQVALLQIQMTQERFRADHEAYGSLAEIGATEASPGGHYTLTVAIHTESGFEVHAAAAGVQDADAPCRHMKLVVDGLNTAYASGSDTSFGNTGPANRQCWSL
ncbi:type IV pilin protein [Piscinibacter sp.]|uniref:type IV pilin protein n=1 Tax=Piscinibacter sp. TaxID=1903157 RepID=UPI002C38FF03|nr:type IV pilin protein [Albitalea sp.]HUG24036.1 type IV pilin protein [Albitalea sp.]